jgi:hypothetical protein
MKPNGEDLAVVNNLLESARALEEAFSVSFTSGRQEQLLSRVSELTSR